jgi:hypothetical protein
MSESAVGAPVRQSQCAFVAVRTGEDRARHDRSGLPAQKTHPGTRTGLIGGATPRGPLSTLTDEALKTAAAGRTAGAAWSALSRGMVAHCHENDMQKACARLVATILKRRTALKRESAGDCGFHVQDGK